MIMPFAKMLGTEGTTGSAIALQDVRPCESEMSVRHAPENTK